MGETTGDPAISTVHTPHDEVAEYTRVPVVEE